LTQITSTSLALPAHTKGRFAIVTNVGQRMRWTRVALLTRALFCGRRSRVVLTPQWLASSFAEEDFREVTVTIKPDHRGEREGNR
jgi:hypothetical protein